MEEWEVHGTDMENASMDGGQGSGIQNIEGDLDGEGGSQRGICATRPTHPTRARKQERQRREREEFSEGSRLSTNSDDSETSDAREVELWISQVQST